MSVNRRIARDDHETRVYPSFSILPGRCYSMHRYGVEAIMTKRQLGLIFILLGVGAAVGMFAIDMLGAGQFQGIGPAQRRVLLAAVLAVLVGLTLWPLGDRPA
jgi:hypothetical protein